MKVMLAVLTGSSTEAGPPPEREVEGGSGLSGTGSVCLEVTDPLEMRYFTISESL